MNAINMGDFIAPKSNQLNADDLTAGPRTITITRVSANPSEPTQPVAMNFDGDGGKPYLPCKSMRRVFVSVWGADASKYVGRSLTIYRDPSVTFGGMSVGGIRISHMSHIDAPVTLAITMSKAKRAPMTIKPLATQQRQAPAPRATDETVAYNPETGELPPIDKAAQWADATLAAIAATADRAALAELQQASQKALAKLSAQRPELSELVSMAFVERLGVFSAGDVAEPELDDAPF
jgi:hypothetical protein